MIKIKQNIGILGINIAITTFGAFILLVAIQVFIIPLDPFSASLIAAPLAFLLAFLFCLPLFIYSLLQKSPLELKNNKFLFLIFPIPLIFIGHLVYAMQKFWDIFSELGFISVSINLVIAYLLLIILYFSLLEIYRSKSHKKKIKALFQTIFILLLGSVFLNSSLRGPQIELYREKNFDQKINSFSISPEEALNIVNQWEKTHEAKISTWGRPPQIVIGEYYYFPPFEKLVIALSATGYYVNGHTGTLEFRTSNHFIKETPFGSPTKIPSDIFTSIEILKEGNTENSQ